MEYGNVPNPSFPPIDSSNPNASSPFASLGGEWQQHQAPQQLMQVVPSAADASLEEAMWRMALQQPQGIDSSFPERPGEPDCAYYMRTGLCGFGINCKFNHPPNRRSVGAWSQGEYPERPGQPDCQYYVKTGTCKFGATCKYHHPRDKAGLAEATQLNILSLPLRQGEKDCAYYMRTGHCKFGATCKFNHPQPMLPLPSSPGFAAPPSSGSSAAGIPQPYPSWPAYSRGTYLPPRLPGPSSLATVLLPPTGGVVSVPAWSAYQENQQQQGLSTTSYVYAPAMSPQEPMAMGLYPYMPISPSMRLPTPPSPSSMGASHETPYPERPGQPDCQYYLKTGVCRFGSQCRYHHPRERNASPQINALSPMGHPIRPGAPPCTFYSRYGFCKFGLACKFDHPFTSTPYPFLLGDIPQYPVGMASLPTTGDTLHLEAPLQLQRQLSARETLEERDRASIQRQSSS